MNEDRTKRKLCGILSADVAGYSRLMEEDEAWTIRTLEQSKGLIGRLVDEYEGRVVDAPGDNLLAEFNSVLNAVECAGKIQKELKRKNADITGSRKMEFRIGVNLGEVVEGDGRIYGSGVNIAARLERLAKPGGICISSTAYEQVYTKLDLGYEYLGEHNVKNISEPIRVYRVLLDSEIAEKSPPEKKKASGKSARAAVLIILLVVIAAGAAGWLAYFRTSGSAKQDAPEPEQASAVRNGEQTSKTIAVLPFTDLSQEKDQEYFADGLSEEILNSLTQIPGLTVISRTSSFAFKGTNKTIPEIASILGVSNILEGSVRKSGNDLRITAKLIRAEDSAQLFSKQYDCEFKDIFEIETNIATSVANELKLTLGIENFPRPSGSPEDLKAYEWFVSARGQSSRREWDRSLESLRSAVKLNPGFADAWNSMARDHLSLAPEATPERVIFSLDQGLKAAQKAVELKPDSARAYLTLGNVYSFRGNFIEAEKAYRKALELSPESERSLFLIMHYTKMGYLKRCNELLGAMGRFDPLQPLIDAANILNLGFMNDLEQAEKEYKRGKSIFPDQWVYGDFNITILRLGSGKVLSQEDIPMLPMPNLEPVWSIGRNNIASPEEGLTALRNIYNTNDKLNSMHLITMSCFAAYFGDTAFALDAMKKSVKLETSGLYFLWTPIMKEVRKLPQFQDFLNETGLTEYWKEFGWPDKCRPSDTGILICN